VFNDNSKRQQLQHRKWLPQGFRALVGLGYTHTALSVACSMSAHPNDATHESKYKIARLTRRPVHFTGVSKRRTARNVRNVPYHLCDPTQFGSPGERHCHYTTRLFTIPFDAHTGKCKVDMAATPLNSASTRTLASNRVTHKTVYQYWCPSAIYNS
jgi:hypothetical protein